MSFLQGEFLRSLLNRKPSHVIFSRVLPYERRTGKFLELSMIATDLFQLIDDRVDLGKVLDRLAKRTTKLNIEGSDAGPLAYEVIHLSAVRVRELDQLAWFDLSLPLLYCRNRGPRHIEDSSGV